MLREEIEELKGSVEIMEKKVKEQTLATEMLREIKAQSKRWFISFIIVLMLWFATIGVFIWYINQPIEEVETTTTQDADTEGDNSPINQHIGE